MKARPTGADWTSWTEAGAGWAETISKATPSVAQLWDRGRLDRLDSKNQLEGRAHLGLAGGGAEMTEMTENGAEVSEMTE